MIPIRIVAASSAAVFLGAAAFVLLRRDVPVPPPAAVVVVRPTTPAPTPAPPTAPAPVPPVVAVAPPAVTAVVPTFGADVSWPNCPLGTPGHLPKRQAKGLGMPGPGVQFVIIGLTNGPGFYPNPCLAQQVAEAKRRRLLTAAYAFMTLPNADQIRRYGGQGPWQGRTAIDRVRNASWAQAQVNLDSIRRTGLRTPIVWMDVEPQPYLSPWGTDVAINRAVIEASQAAYRRAGYATGFYSAPYAWQPITGGLRDGSPTWVTSGPRSRTVAESKCSAPSFSGGPVALSQFWVTDVMDYNVTCPLVRADVRRYFATN